jgi:hypothetical protein
MLRRITIVTALLAAVAVFATASPALAATVIGQTAVTNGIGCGGATRIQTGVGSAGSSFVVPSGNWLLTSWSTLASSAGGQMAAVVARATGTPGQYTIVAVTQTQTLTASTLNTFSVSISVQAGDILGLWGSGSNGCVLETGNGGDGEAYSSGSAPVAGSTLNLTAYSGYILNISATLSPVVSAVVRQPDSAFLCYSKYERDGGAVFEAGQAAELSAGGYWAPSAVAGVVQGGTNLGTYHLECNPPATLKATAAYIGGGGDVVTDPWAAHTLGYYPVVA